MRLPVPGPPPLAGVGGIREEAEDGRDLEKNRRWVASGLVLGVGEGEIAPP